MASAVLEILLLGRDGLSAGETTTLRDKLVRYCERDTLAMVRLHERLVELGCGRSAAWSVLGLPDTIGRGVDREVGDSGRRPVSAAGQNAP